MKIRCARCKELFEPSPSQKATLRSPTARRFCSHTCRCQDQERPPEQPERRALVPEDLYTGGQELHLRVGRKRDLQKLLRAIADVDCELTPITGHRSFIRDSEKRAWNADIVKARGSAAIF
jgi:hypothetical protein